MKNPFVRGDGSFLVGALLGAGPIIAAVALGSVTASAASSRPPACAPSLRVIQRVAGQAGVTLGARLILPMTTGTPAYFARELRRGAGRGVNRQAMLTAAQAAGHVSDNASAGRFIAALESAAAACPVLARWGRP